MLIDDDEDDYFVIRSTLSSIKNSKIHLDWKQNSLGAVQSLIQQSYDVILIDYHLGPESGLQVIQSLIQTGSAAPMILLSGIGSYEIDLEAMQAGALFYLDKNEISPRVLERTIRYAIERKQIEQALKQKEIAYEQLYIKEARHVRQLEALQAATRVLMETLDFEKLTERVLGAVLTAIPAAEESLLFFPIPASGDCCRQGVSSKRENLPPRLFTLKEDTPVSRLTRAAVLEGRSIKVDAFVRPSAAGPAGDNGSLLTVPLMHEGELFGAITLVSARPGSFEDNDLTFLESFAATTTAALHNARLHEKIQQLAITDSLTGLLNRRGFFNYAERELSRFQRVNKAFSLIMVDLDHFKEVNDTYGHPFGDKVLQEMAQICLKDIRKIDLIGRYGGDEFIILLPDTKSERAVQVAERIRACFESFRLDTEDGKSLSFTASFGVAQADAQTQTLDDLIPQADAALYASKNKGRNQVILK